MCDVVGAVGATRRRAVISLWWDRLAAVCTAVSGAGRQAASHVSVFVRTAAVPCGDDVPMCATRSCACCYPTKCGCLYEVLPYMV